MIHSANATVNRREGRLLRERLAAMDSKLDRALVVAKEVGAVAPAFTAQDAWDLSEVLASNGTEGLPPHSHIETRAVETTTPLQRPYGRTFTTVCTSVTIWPLDPRTPAECLLQGLLDTSGRLQPSVYERTVNAHAWSGAWRAGETLAPSHGRWPPTQLTDEMNREG